jgi:hypothetical protein
LRPLIAIALFIGAAILVVLAILTGALWVLGGLARNIFD